MSILDLEHAHGSENYRTTLARLRRNLDRLDAAVAALTALPHGVDATALSKLHRYQHEAGELLAHASSTPSNDTVEAAITACDAYAAHLDRMAGADNH